MLTAASGGGACTFTSPRILVSWVSFVWGPSAPTASGAAAAGCSVVDIRDLQSLGLGRHGRRVGGHHAIELGDELVERGRIADDLLEPLPELARADDAVPQVLQEIAGGDHAAQLRDLAGDLLRVEVPHAVDAEIDLHL